MKATNARETPLLRAPVASTQRAIVCAWCGQTVGRKPLSGARLSHTICAPCIQQFFAEPDSRQLGFD